MPPALRNHRTPTAGDTPASTAASSLDRPKAIAVQNRLQFSRRASRSRPGDRKAARTHRSESRLHFVIATSFDGVLRRPIESAQYSRAFHLLPKRSGILDHPLSRVVTAEAQTLTGPNSSKCPRRCSQLSRIRLGIATSTQIAKNSGQPVALATKPAPEER